MVLEKWDGDRHLYLTIINDRKDSFVYGNRMRVESYAESDGIIELRDDIGICARLVIRRQEQ